ncbi:SpoIIE family protein phosphatase [Modestobacter sp. I12A-02628]|uniref:SpoIIE family protein phosphatase n=1 Tax=Goekera deserti TaxID=2497753 RepID=A0A7K3WD38_9ACTN|nr:SpoIIE family protein phosphatase [Goekera deserti]MPQ96977.1 SpoIIE family protein phosphatase [Goekera deserti]NDI46708.1 SpoIIE family protein phosphatase [Goekera deserti]NEL54277.1 SpoIIE family protein phosphatase [Goekera deserti]
MSPSPPEQTPGPRAERDARLLAALRVTGRALWAVDGDGVFWANARAQELAGSGGGLPVVGGRRLDELAAAVVRDGVEQRTRGALGGPDADGPQVLASSWLLDLDGRPGALVVLDPHGGTLEDADLVEQVQHALLPPTLPLLPGMRLSGSYHQASRVGSAGGDWYDAVPLGGGRLALVIGDAVGSGVPAVGAMGRLRGAVRASAQRDPEPAGVVAALDAFAAGTGDVDGASVFYGLLDAATGRLSYAAAGHPAPIVVHRDGASSTLDVEPRPPLGTVPGVTATVGACVLEPGETLVLFSDGALSALTGGPAEGIRLLAEASHRAVVALEADPDTDIAGTVAEMLRGRFDRPDDVAVLVAHRRASTPGPLVLELPAVPAGLSGVRRRLGTWLATLGMAERDRVGLLVAAGEACANSVEHAYPEGEAGLLHVHADVDVDGVLTVVVRDDGRWRTPDREPGDRGRGLLIMRQMVDQVLLEETGGTTVTLSVQLRRGGDREREQPVGGAEDLAVVDRTGPLPVVRVSGALDAGNAEQMRIRLLEASRGGTTPCVLDLTDTALFNSAGVRVVFAVARIAQAEGWRLTVRTHAEGMAAHVLGISGASSLVDLV